MRTKGKGKTVGGPMETNIRRVEIVVEEERGVVDIVTSAVKWVTRLMSAHGRRTSVLGVEGWGIGPMFVGRGWSASTVG
ncbi:hypothetical protein A2U01_0081977, partial [Trifolium medium]|nr:hypothetical protein [Trifolium medium]